MSKRIIVSVISDLVTDQRVQKECNTLHNCGYDVLLVGRKSNDVFGLDGLPYKTIRFKNLFARGPLMYLVFNAQLFFFLLFKKPDVLWANDLDTLLPNFIIARLKNLRLVYDSHEYFTMSVPKKTSRWLWQQLESYLFLRLKNVITVNDSIKNVYEKKYKVPIIVVRNVPYKSIAGHNKPTFLPKEKKKLVMQGIGLNENRGAEEAVLMMQFLNDDYLLYFIGRGTVLPKLKAMVERLKLNEKICFVDPLPYREMMEYTRQCFLGLIFEKIEVNEEHMFALPNKLFDYLAAGVPVLSSKAVEIKAIIAKYDVGDLIDDFDPARIAEKITKIAASTERYNQWKRNTSTAANELCWEIEEIKLKEFMATLC